MIFCELKNLEKSIQGQYYRAQKKKKKNWNKFSGIFNLLLNGIYLSIFTYLLYLFAYIHYW